MSNSSSNVVDGEIEAAFTAGAMPPEWRWRLLASGLNGNDVSVIAASIAKTHPILRTTWSSKENMAFNAFGVLGGLFLCLVAVVVFRETKGLMLLVLGVFYVVMTHRLLGDTWWSNENVVFEAFGLFGTLFAFAFAIVFRETKGLMLSLLIWGLVLLAAAFLLAVIDGCERRRAKLIRDVVRKVLENFLLPPV